jgi:hypothetical protein
VKLLLIDSFAALGACLIGTPNAIATIIAALIAHELVATK